MKNETSFFRHRQLQPERLPPYGFVRTEKGYVYKTHLIDVQLNMIVLIDQNEAVMTELTDPTTESEYILHKIAEAQGKFVGLVREAYEAQLIDIAEQCFTKEVFKSTSAKAVIDYVDRTYGDALEFLWKKSPNNAIFRRRDTGKWYAVLLTVKKEKLGLAGSGTIEIIDLRILPDQLEETVDHKKYFFGYHMNKRSWYTICLDSSVEDQELFRRIDTSYELAK